MTVFDLLKDWIESLASTGEWFGAIAAFLLILTAIAWIFLPLAIFGIKSKLDDIKKELQSINRKGG